MYIPKVGTANRIIYDLNIFMHEKSKNYKYFIDHITLARKYLLLLGKKLDIDFNPSKLTYIALSHDLFKEKYLNKNQEVIWRGYNIPQDTNRYVRTNLDILEKFGLDDYFNTDISLHALSAGIFLYKEFGITDKNILYPVFFHSCPIVSIYETLPLKTRMLIDIMMLADKLSSNFLKIENGNKVFIDLNLLVFGKTYKEFNYSMGLYLSRIISQGKSKETQSTIATEYYFKRLQESNSLITKPISYGDDKLWEKRKLIFREF